MRPLPLLLLIVSLLLGTATSALAQVSICPGGGWTTGATHAAGTGSNRLLVVAVGGEWNLTGTNDFSAVTYGGQSLTLIRREATSFSGLNYIGTLWYLDEAGITAATSDTIGVTTTGASLFEFNVAAVTYCNVSQVEPIGLVRSTQASPLGLDPISSTIAVGAQNAIVSATGNTSAGSYTWLQDVSEATDQAGSSSTWSTADGSGFTTTADQTAEADFGGFVGRNVLLVAEILGTPPVAEFSGTPLSGAAPLTTVFTNESTGVVDLRLWNFGDGATSSIDNPSHTYTQPGVYTVRLTVRGPHGIDTEIKTDYITVNEPAPVAEFSGTPTSGTAPLTTNFTDLSTGPITSWAWDFGDGGTSTLQSPSHTYTTSGSYTVALTVTGPGGADTETKTAYVMVAAAPPVAEFSGTPLSGTAPVTTVFTDLSTGDITSWAWDFGDGGTSTLQSPSHTYTTSGSYTVALTVTGPGGADTETKTAYVMVAAAPPVAEFSGTPLSGTAPVTTVFTDLSTGEITSWAWDFGDGGTSTLQSPSHTYTTSGSYTVALTVTGPGGADTETKTAYVTVAAAPPVAEFSGTPLSGTAPVTTVFTDLSTGEITSWAWDFGDGGTSTLQSPSHTYTTSGSYTVALTVTGPGGADTETKTAYVTVAAAPPVAEFSGTPLSGTAPVTTVFTDLSTGEITGWAWDFGDGGTSTLPSPSHTYTASGSYTVALTVTGPGGADTETKTAYVTVAAAPPVAEFSGTPLSGTAPVTTVFTDLSTGEITGWAWDFGDGGTSTLPSPSHTYTVGGSYTVVLTVTGPGGSDGETKMDYVTVNATGPVAEFSGTPLSGTAPVTTVFTDESTGQITSWAWDFGDGGTSTLQSPSHTYTASGSYTVALTVTGPGGADTETKTAYVMVAAAPPVAEFSGTPLSGTAPVTTVFTDLSTGEITSWAWDFGDGSTSTLPSPSHTYTLGGSYTVVLTVTGPGGSDGETKMDYVTVNATGPVAEFSGTPLSGTAPVTTVFTDESTGQITSWAWDFGDGGTSTLQSPSHTYTASGSYTVALTVTGPGGADTETKTDYVTVVAVPPAAEFLGSPTGGMAPLTTTFTDLSTGEITSWGWTFGDGGTSTDPNPVHIYNQDGSYTVSLTVTGPGGAGTETKLDYIQVSSGAPVAEFSGAPTSGTTPLTVFFTDASSGNVLDWLWDFGDGATSTAQNPFHDYDFLGPHTVSLTVTGPGGSSTETKIDYITVLPAVLGTNYCVANPNSSGLPADITAMGSLVVAVNDVRLEATDLPPNQFGFFLSSPTQGFIPNPAGSAGNFCLGLGSMVGRFNAPAQIRNSGPAGEFGIRINLNAIPISTAPFTIGLQPGDTWNFQAWYRDVGSQSNFTDGVSITFE